MMPNSVLATLNVLAARVHGGKPRFSAKHYYEQMQRYLDEATKHYKNGDRQQGDQYYAMHKTAKANYYRKLGKAAGKIKLAAKLEALQISANFYEDDTCLRCGKPIDHSKSVWLERHNKKGIYCKPGIIPEKHSQGQFEFGADCAKAILKNGGVLEYSGLKKRQAKRN